MGVDKETQRSRQLHGHVIGGSPGPELRRAPVFGLRLCGHQLEILSNKRPCVFSLHQTLGKCGAGPAGKPHVCEPKTITLGLSDLLQGTRMFQ